MRTLQRTTPVLLALLIALAAYQPIVPAQPAPDAAKPLLLTTDEIKLWQAWMRGDLKGTYLQAQAMAEPGRDSYQDVVAAFPLQARAADQLGWHEAHVKDLKEVLERYPGSDGLRWRMMESLKRLGRINEVKEQAAALNHLTGWQIAGPFPNDRGQGFEDIQDVEEDVDLEAEYFGKEGQTVSFRPLPVKPVDGVINLGAMLRPNQEATAFLLTAVHAEREGEATLRVGSTGPVKAWRLNTRYQNMTGGVIESDHPIGPTLLEVDVERDLGFDQDDGEFLRLKAGWNLLLVKAGVAETDWKLRVRLLFNGKWREAASPDELREALAADTTHAYPHSRDLAENPDYGPDGADDARAAMHELLIPRRDRHSSFARLAIARALAVFDEQLAELPETARAAHNAERAVLCFIAAWANRSSARFSAGREENRRRELLKECLELDPSAARAALELSQYYTTTFGNPTLADEYAQLAVRANPDWTEGRVYASRVVAMKGLDIEVERELAKLLQEKPGDASVLRFAAYYAGLRRDYRLSNDLFARALRVDFADGYSRDRLLERAVARGDTQSALKLAAEARMLDPFDTQAALQLSEMFTNAEQFALAERELTRALRIAPRDDALLARLGGVYTAWADASEGDRAAELRAKALQAYQAVLESNPRREDVERYLEFIDGEQPAFEAALQEDITERIQAALQTPLNDDDPYEVIYRDEIVVVNEDGTTAQYIQEAYRVTNDNGREWLQRLRVPAWSDQQGRVVEARVWRADGDIEEGRRSAWVASFPPLEIGDIVHVRFRVSDRQQSFFGDFYGTRTVLMDYVPVREVRHVWVLPPGRQFHEYLTGSAPARVESTVNNRRVWSYRAENLPKLHDEPRAPGLHMRSPTIQLSTYATWREWGRWYYNLIRRQLEPTAEMTAKVNELTRGLETEREKAKAVYTWVVRDVRYNADWHFGVHGYKPFSAGAVFARAIGDCKDKAILICAMLEIAGVKAYPVIINLEYFRGDEDITLPMPDHFNHAIAYIEYSDGTGQFVDGTATYNGINELPAADRGANVIIVRPDGGEHVRIDPGQPEDDSQTDEMTIEFVPGGALKVSVKRTAVGDSAATIRARFEREGDRKRRLEAEWARFYPGARVDDVTVNDLADIHLPPVVRYTVELPNAWTTRNGNIEFKAGLDPREWTKSEFAALTLRRTDLLTPAPFERVGIAHFKLPDGYTVTPPADLEIDHANARLSVSATLKDGVLTIKRTYALLGGTVKAADYPEFRRGLIRYDSAEAAVITLTRNE